MHILTKRWICPANSGKPGRMIPLSHQSPVSLSACHLAKAIDTIGDRWTLLILRSALFGVRRFDDFQRELGAPRTVLSGRLKALTQNGILEKRMYKTEGKRARPEYVLTKTGMALRPVLIALTQWSDDCLSQGKPPPLSFTDAASRQPIKVAFVDTSGRKVPPSQMRVALRR